MGIIAIIIPMIFGILSYANYKRIFNIQFVFNLLWFFVMLFSYLNLLQNIPIKREIYTMGIIFILVFNFGAIFANFFKLKKKENNNGYSNQLFIKLCIILVFCSYLLLYIRFIEFILNGGSFDNIRYEYFYGNSIIRTVWGSLYYSYLVDGVYNFLTLYLIYNLFNKGNIKITIAILVLIAMNLTYTGGRLDLLQIIVLIVVNYYIYRKSINKKMRKKIMLLMDIAIIGAIYISLQRNVTDLLRQPIAYFVSPLAFASALIDNYTIPMLGLGRVVFAPVLDFSINFLRFFKLTDLVSAAISISDITKNALPIGLNGDTFNALVPAYFHLYMGSGYASIIIFGFLFGWVSIIVERKRFLYKSMGIELVWMMLLMGVLFSSMGWQFMHVNELTTLLCIFIAQRRKNGNTMAG